MNITLSDVVWTVICFILFMLVMNFLLLRPVLKNMDARKEKIRRAKLLAEEREEEAERLREQKLLDEQRAADLAREESKKRLADEREEAEREISDLASSLAGREEEEMREISDLAREADEKLASGTDGMADAFTEKLMTGGDV